ncbi:hypothetical protein [Micromonospora sp. CA-244673]|uniref:hypothetical protein n=1 Tax=Micromonospora sp. CA-244673 TaxID=3239958 RepID=UPI003D8DBA2E
MVGRRHCRSADRRRRCVDCAALSALPAVRETASARGQQVTAAGVEDGLASPIIRGLLHAAPDPTTAAALTIEQISGLLVRAGRRRYITAAATRLHAIFQARHLRQPPMIESAFGRQAHRYQQRRVTGAAPA